MRMKPFRRAALTVVVFTSLYVPRAYAAVAECGIVIVRTYPHDPGAFPVDLEERDRLCLRSQDIRTPLDVSFPR